MQVMIASFRFIPQARQVISILEQVLLLQISLFLEITCGPRRHLQVSQTVLMLEAAPCTHLLEHFTTLALQHHLVDICAQVRHESIDL